MRTQRFSKNLLTFGLALALLFVSAEFRAQSGVDFGLARLEEGKEAFADRRFDAAIDNLRIAAFALLDRPPRLLESLIRLAVAQSAAGWTIQERRETLDRILGLEERFRLYPELDLEAEVRQSFQQILHKDVSAQALSAVPELVAAPAPRRQGPMPATASRPPARAERARTANATGPAPTGIPVTMAPSFTPSAAAVPTEKPSPTNTSLPPTATPSATASPTATSTAVPPTATVMPPTATSSPTKSPTPSPTPIPATATAAPTTTPTFTATSLTPTATRVPTGTPLPPRPTPSPRTAAAPGRRAERDHGPKPVFTPAPVYPPEDLKARIRGLVELRVLVSETGVPGEIVVVEAARGHLTQAAVAAVRTWRFQPAIRAGRPVAAWTTVEIPFEAIPYPTAIPPSVTPKRSPTKGPL